jgi:cobalt-zinc-cadmium efflux system protein
MHYPGHVPHKHEPHGHHHHVQALQKSAKLLSISLVITLGFAGVEALAGYLSGSLTLMSDAGHMLTDSMSLALGATAAWIANRPMTGRMSYGYGRAEVLAALTNGLLMLGVIAGIVYAAIGRFQNLPPVRGGTVVLVAGLGLVINVLVAYILSRDAKSLNTRAALLHVFGDLLGSVAALVSGIVIVLTGWMLIDPILALVISTLILYSTYGLLKESFRVVMEGVPSHLNLDHIRSEILDAKGVISIEDLHVWTLASNQTVLSAHIRIEDLSQWHVILGQLHERLHHHFGIDHITIQPISITGVVVYHDADWANSPG